MTSKAPKVLGTNKFTEDKLKSLANNPSNIVCQHVYDTPEAFLTPDQQIQAYRALIMAFDTACVKYPEETDEALRERVLNARADIRLFQRLYSKNFAFSTVRALDDAMEERLDKIRKMNMVMLVERATGEGTEEEKAARAMSVAMRMAMRPTTSEDRSGSTQVLDKHVKEAGISKEQLKPIDRFELGETSVRQ